MDCAISVTRTTINAYQIGRYAYGKMRDLGYGSQFDRFHVTSENAGSVIERVGNAE